MVLLWFRLYYQLELLKIHIAAPNLGGESVSYFFSATAKSRVKKEKIYITRQVFSQHKSPRIRKDK